MKLKYLLFIIIFLIVYLLLNYYIGTSILKLTNNFFILSSKIYWIIFIIIAMSYIIAMVFNKYLPNPLGHFFELLGSYWMAIFMYALLLFPIIQIFNFFIKTFNFSSTVTTSILGIEALTLLAVFLYIIVFGSINAKHSYVNKFNITTDKEFNEENLNIVMLSDLHLGNLVGSKNLSTLVKDVNKLNPDLIIFAGDIVDSDITAFVKNDMAKLFSNLKSKYGVYAALGNHDLMVKDINKLIDDLRDNNVSVLRNEALLINDSFYIIGRDDISAPRFGYPRKSLDDIASSLDSSKLKIVIDHTPSSLDESLASGVDLHFSGHTHRGQIAPGNIITKKIFEIDHGYLKKESLNIVVSSGYGTWGPPLRIGSKSEIVNVKLSNQ